MTYVRIDEKAHFDLHRVVIYIIYMTFISQLSWGDAWLRLSRALYYIHMITMPVPKQQLQVAVFDETVLHLNLNLDPAF